MPFPGGGFKPKRGSQPICNWKGTFARCCQAPSFCSKPGLKQESRLADPLGTSRLFMALSALLGLVSRKSSSSPKHRTGAPSSKPWLYSPDPFFSLVKSRGISLTLVVRCYLASGTIFFGHIRWMCEISAINMLIGFSYAYIQMHAFI